jgi:hypothetical protein
MDKYRNVFAKFTDFENQYYGYRLARRDKRYKPEVLLYSANLGDHLWEGIESLENGTYHIDGVREFLEYFPKKRIITAWPFKYRVVNCAAYLTLWPIYSRSFFEHSYGSIPGKGATACCEQIRKWLQETQHTGRNPWCAKGDVAKFFFRLPHDVQLRELGKPLDDKRMMWFLETCIKGDGRPMGLPLDCGDPTEAERIFGIGMPVGSLISQMTANVAMNPIDHFIKRELHIPHYARYMDDLYLQGKSKGQLWDALGRVDEKLKSEFGLQLNHKTAVMPWNSGIEFVGKIITANSVTVRKSTSLRMKQHLNFIRKLYAEGEVSMEYALSVMVSYLGLLKHTDCDALKEKICRDYVLVRHNTPDECREVWEYDDGYTTESD